MPNFQGGFVICHKNVPTIDKRTAYTASYQHGKEGVLFLGNTITVFTQGHHCSIVVYIYRQSESLFDRSFYRKITHSADTAVMHYRTGLNIHPSGCTNSNSN